MYFVYFCNMLLYGSEIHLKLKTNDDASNVSTASVEEFGDESELLTHLN